MRIFSIRQNPVSEDVSRETKIFMFYEIWRVNISTFMIKPITIVATGIDAMVHVMEV